MRFADDGSASAYNQRPFGAQNQFCGFAQLVQVGHCGWVVRTHFHIVRVVEQAFCLNYVFGQVHQHCAGPPGTGHVKSFGDDGGKVVDVLHQIIVFCAWPGDAHNIHFLKGVVPDKRAGHLAGENNNRNGVAIRGGNAGDRVGCARPGSYQSHPDFAGCPGVAVGCVNGGLFMADKNMADVVAGDFVINVKHRSARITEKNVYALALESFHQHSSASHFAHKNSPKKVPSPVAAGFICYGKLADQGMRHAS